MPNPPLRTLLRPSTLRAALALAAGALLSTAQASECELNGESVSMYNGNTTAGKSGLVRCFESAGGPLRDERTLRNGNFVGPQRQYQNGVLLREFSVNERGNRDGLLREYAATPGANPLLLEETLRDGTRTGIARQWAADGKLKVVRFHDDKGQTLAEAELNARGQPGQLRCGKQALLAPHVDDAAWCGFKGNGPATTELYDPNGQLRARVVHERGMRTKFESLWADGSPREQTETRADGGSERAFLANGKKRYERTWVNVGSGERPLRVRTLEQDFHESGQLLKERRFTPTDRGGQLLSEQTWYLNGQLKSRDDYSRGEAGAMVRMRTFHDNGKPASDGNWALGPDGYPRFPVGVVQTFDAEGRLRSESTHDSRGRVTRERQLAADGSVTRDDEVFEDGSRKAFSK